MLNLGWNGFRSPGAQAIAAGIAENRSLKTLCLVWNGIGAKVRAIIE